MTLRCHLHSRILVIALGFVGLGGCWGGPAVLKPPEFDPDGSAAQAMELYDADGDSTLSGPELERCPAIKGTLREIDANGDQAVDLHELTDRVQHYADSQLGLTTIAAAFTFDGAPLEGAEVTFDPEPFLANAITPATGRSNGSGIAIPVCAGKDVPGITAGMFKVRVSLKDAAGSEQLPAKYNTDTELGQEISPGSEALRQGTVVFDLYSR